MKLEKVIDDALENKIATGIAVSIVDRKNRIFEITKGHTEEEGEDITKATLFDLASLTKVVFTTPYILKLVEDGLLSINDPVSLYVNGFPENITLKNLLTHTGGLKPWLPLFSDDLNIDNSKPYEVKQITKEEAIDKIIKFGIDASPNVKVEYSDLGFILLGFIIETITKKDLKECAREFFDEISMFSTTFGPVQGDVASTEIVQGKHLKGIVHDENARALGGISGHAGLFSNLNDLERYALFILNSGSIDEKRILTEDSIVLMKETATTDLKPERTIGFIKGKYLSTAPDFASVESIGHTGFTGTSIYFDFKRSIAIIILTNRVYYGRENNKHMHLRRIIGNLIYKEIL
ncbi:serine hydrolase domain-containing protein [Caldisericum exile]|uniref:Peptidase S12 family protein n=1 Tax=Caldisericum exile (strain DSM 21853 / NBRC 104410 / AZM16c01) TaxID=511051 RepID=A0A7U6GDJ6_CALEA|nr:serine hydrolase [Caldisericum exile]BAL80428.1 peptidase S12 family protein [Caldisericum exile AZM16c01]